VTTDFERLLGALCAEDVRFIIVGGLAAVIHGSARLTQDIDLVYERSDENIERLVRALHEHHPYLRGAPPGLPFDWSVATLRAGLNFTLTTRVGDIDVFGDIAGGGTYDDLLPHTIEVELFGYGCRCLDLPRLIATKRAAGRARDLEAIAELEALSDERNRLD
jgi:predicted nucleotidyltransferase